MRRIKNTVKKHGRSWVWYLLVISPILLTAWLIINPIYFEKLKEIPQSIGIIEESPEPGTPQKILPRKSISRPQAESEKGIIDNETKEDVDWVLSHIYKIVPLVISVIAVWKRKKIKGK